MIKQGYSQLSRLIRELQYTKYCGTAHVLSSRTMKQSRWTRKYFPVYETLIYNKTCIANKEMIKENLAACKEK